MPDSELRILGLDPGLRNTGWGLIAARGNRLSHLAHGVVSSDSQVDLAQRLCQLHRGLVQIIAQHAPDAAAAPASVRPFQVER